MAPVGDQVPVHRIAERLVDAHAVLVDRQALRRAQHRRGLEAAVEQVGLQGIVEIGVQIDAADPPVQGVGDAGRTGRREIGGGQRGHRVGRLADVDRGPGQRRDRDHRHRRDLARRIVARRARRPRAER